MVQEDAVGGVVYAAGLDAGCAGRGGAGEDY